jgi:hypothetical protein
MRYSFVNEIVSLALDGARRIEVAERFDPDDGVFCLADGPRRVPESMPLEPMAMTAEQPIEDRSIARARLMFVCVEAPA